MPCLAGLAEAGQKVVIRAVGRSDGTGEVHIMPAVRFAVQAVSFAAVVVDGFGQVFSALNA